MGIYLEKRLTNAWQPCAHAAGTNWATVEQVALPLLVLNIPPLHLLLLGCHLDYDGMTCFASRTRARGLTRS